MHRTKTAIYLILGLLAPILACGPDIGVPEVTVPSALETAQETARQAGSVAQTAAAGAGDVAGTAVAMVTREGSGALATVQAIATPHVASLKEKLDIEPDENGVYRVSITEDEVNTLNRVRQVLTGDVIGAAIQSQEISFSEGEIALIGNLFEPLPGRLTVAFRPEVEDGRLLLELTDAALTGAEVPDSALDSAGSALNGTLNEALSFIPGDVQLQEIVVAEGTLTIIGQRIES